MCLCGWACLCGSTRGRLCVHLIRKMLLYYKVYYFIAKEIFNVILLWFNINIFFNKIPCMIYLFIILFYCVFHVFVFVQNLSIIYCPFEYCRANVLWVKYHLLIYLYKASTFITLLLYCYPMFQYLCTIAFWYILFAKVLIQNIILLFVLWNLFYYQLKESYI